MIDALMQALARRIGRHSPLAVSACLAGVTHGINLPIDEALAVEAMQFGRMAAADGIREGIAAFLGRRTAAFAGS